MKSSRQVSLLPGKRRQSGFSLMEVLIAMFVIVVGISGVTATLWWGHKHADSGKIVTEASQHARFFAEKVRLNATPGMTGSTWPNTAGLNDAPSARVALFAPPFQTFDADAAHRRGQSVSVGNQATESDFNRFTRNISYRQLSPGGNPATDYAATIGLLTVRIYWNEEGRERHVAVETLIPVRENP